MLVPRRFIGAALLLAALAPIHRLLDPVHTGPAGRATRTAAEAAWTVGLFGSFIVVTFAWVCIRMVPRGQVMRRIGMPLHHLLSAGSPGAFAASIGGIAALLATGVALLVHGGAPTSVDEMAQLLHARALAGGRLTLPLEGSEAAWLIQNGIVTLNGWVSIYPPLHTVLLALGFLVGAPWLVGPIGIGVASGATVWSAERLMGAGVGRVGGVLLLVSPFWLLLGGTYLSHATAAAALALVLWTGLRARDGGIGWALATGVSVGAAVATRPWIGLACSLAILLALWLPSTVRSTITPAAFVRRVAAVVVGGLPFAVCIFWWNDRLFGSPFRLGYTAAFGPAHGLGFGVDPWGNRYGPVEALAYTGADLVQLGVRILESPLPIVAVIGGVLLARPLRTGAGVFAAWAAAAVVANAAYWHHGIHMGPRMLFESTPAWIALFVAAASVFAPTSPESAPPARTGQGSVSGDAPNGDREPVSTLQRLAMWSIGLAVVAGLALAPGAARVSSDSNFRVEAPQPPSDDAIVFVHGSWASRIAARLASTGMRRDSIETVLRRNDVCSVDRYARWRSTPGGADPAPHVDTEPRSGSPTSLESRALSPGNLVRVLPGSQPDAACIREARSDRLGVLELELLAWRFPPMPNARIVVARDLGPAGNLPVLHALARPAYLYVDTGSDTGFLLLDYSEGMELLWGGAAGEGAAEDVR